MSPRIYNEPAPAFALANFYDNQVMLGALPAILQRPRKHARYEVVLTDRRLVTIPDQLWDTPRKRTRGARQDHRALARRALPGVPLWEFCMWLPEGLDILSHQGQKEARAALHGGLDSYAPGLLRWKMEDAQKCPDELFRVHVHGLIHAGEMPVLLPEFWVRPRPLDVLSRALSSTTSPTAFGFFWYANKPVLSAFNYPYRDRANLTPEGQRVAGQLIANIERFDSAKSRLRRRQNLPPRQGWLTPKILC
jgi:hypothetical protein